MLIINDLSLRIAGRLLLDHASLTLPAGTKAGLVGRNGTGKTTLFKAITGDLPVRDRLDQPAEEHAHRPGGAGSARHRGAADRDRAARPTSSAPRCWRRRQTATDPHRIAEIHMRLADIDAHSAEARAATILAGLGFDDEAQRRPASSFSGGWRMRVALAAVLFSEPDLLLLDEPTNYLDLEGTLWLENYVVEISAHGASDQPRPRPAQPRRQLDRPSRPEEADLLARRLRPVRAPARRADASCRRRAASSRKRARKHLQSFVDRFRAKASKARQAQSRIKALEKMKPIAAIVDDTVRPFSFPEPVKTVASPIIALNGVNVGYQPGKPILKKMTLRIDADDRIALLGANGNGKSTFAKLLAGPAEAGDRHDDDGAGPEGGDLRPAPARRSAAGGKRLRACPPADAGGAGSEGARRASPSSA